MLSLAGLAALVALQAAIAWNAHLYWKAKAISGDPAERARMLVRANAVYPWNDLVHFELGKACFERGAEALGDPPARDALFARAVDAFLRALRLNPGEPAVHFHLAQTLLYMDYLSLPAPLAYFDEYKRAAELTGHSSQIYFEAGKVLLSHWDGLAAGEKDFTLDILRKALAGKAEERLLDLLETWNLHVRDYGLVERILPENAAALRTYARFLGERALSLEVRHAALAKAERLDFLRAKNEVELGLREAESASAAEASAHYASALEALGAVRFYQAFTGRELIDPGEFAEVHKNARRLLAMNRIEGTRSLADPDGAIAAYLAIEDRFTVLGEFESFIKERGLLGESVSAAAPVKDLETLAFKLTLDFKQSRYRDIVRTGDLLASSSLVISPSGRPSYVRVLSLIGESYLKLDYVYEAEKFFRMALAADPGHLDSLLGLERCYGRLNDEAGAAEVRASIALLISPRATDLGGRTVRKGGSFEQVLTSDGRVGTVRLEFAPAAAAAGRGLVSVFFNGHVGWEGYPSSGPAEFRVMPLPGRNSLEITAAGDDIGLARIILEIPPAR
jgi:tetratricopeptide (TPR) repeat protein